jgi:dihydroorotase
MSRAMSDRLSIARPDDWHVHLRDGEVLAAVLPFTARDFGRAVVMPNLRPPVATVAQALAYRERILEVLPEGSSFEPLMTLYLTSATSPEEIARLHGSRSMLGVKLYPAGATTHSEAGVRSLDDCTAVLEAMQALDVPLMIHGEVTRPDVDVFDRERIFLDEVLEPLRSRFPALRTVLEHITTAEAVQYVEQAQGRIGATITAHHLRYSRSAMFLGRDGSTGIRPHYYCLPVLKRERHRRELLRAATGGNPRFFLGTDSAPHARNAKETACGCAGCFTAPLAMPLYAQAFEEAGALERLEAFASFHGADFYGLPRNTSTITLLRDAPVELPPIIAAGQPYVPLGEGDVSWSVVR